MNLKPYADNSLYNHFLSRLTNIDIAVELIQTITNRFKWQGNLPNLEYIELINLFNASVAVINTPEYGTLLTPYNAVGNYNVFGYPTRIQPFNIWGGMTFDMSDDFAVMFDNRQRFANIRNVSRYAKRLAKIDRAIDSNCNSVKSGFIIVSKSETEDLTKKTIAQQINEDNGFIFVRDGNLLDDNIKPFQLNTTLYAKELLQIRQGIYNDFLNLEGINTVNIIKQERLITDEANANNEVIKINLDNWLIPRLKFCEEVNKKYPHVNLSVSVNEESVGGDRIE